MRRRYWRARPGMPPLRRRFAGRFGGFDTEAMGAVAGSFTDAFGEALRALAGCGQESTDRAPAMRDHLADTVTEVGLICQNDCAEQDANEHAPPKLLGQPHSPLRTASRAGPARRNRTKHQIDFPFKIFALKKKFLDGGRLGAADLRHHHSSKALASAMVASAGMSHSHAHANRSASVAASRPGTSIVQSRRQRTRSPTTVQNGASANKSSAFGSAGPDAQAVSTASARIGSGAVRLPMIHLEVVTVNVIRLQGNAKASNMSCSIGGRKKAVWS